jgi:hypothetical protein
MENTVPLSQRRQSVSNDATRTGSIPAQRMTTFFADGAPPSARRDTHGECYARFIAIARSLDARDVVPYRGDEQLCLSNAGIGLDHLEPHLEKIRVLFSSKVLDDMLTVCDVARAVCHATTLVATTSSKNPEEIRKRLARARQNRKLAISLVHAWVKRGDLTQGDLEGLGQKSTPQVIASDCVLLSGIFEKHAATLKGKHPFAVAEIAQLREDGEVLKESLKVRGQKLSKKENHSRTEVTPENDRDRLWTMLVQRHALMEAAAVLVFKEKKNEKVPALRARVVVAKEAKQKPEKQPKPRDPNVVDASSEQGSIEDPVDSSG